MKTTLWALGLMAASILLALGCGGKGAYVPEFTGGAPCHPTVRLQIYADTSQISLVPGEEKDIAIIVKDLNAVPDADKPKNGGGVTLAVQGTLPSGVSASLSPTYLYPTFEGAVSYLTVDASSAAVPGTFSITVVGTIGACVQSAPIQVTISQSQGDPFTITPNFSAVSVPLGDSIDLDFTVRSTQPTTPGSRVPFSYSIHGPAEFRHAMSVTPTDITPTPSGVVITLHLNVGTLTPTGMYNLELWGSDGSNSDDAPFTLLVTQETPK